MSIDIKNPNISFIITGIAGLIEDEGKTVHEAYRILEDIKRECYSAFAELHCETKEANK